MTTNTPPLSATEILEKILNSKGSFVKACWKSNPKPSKDHKGVLLEKRTSAVCRAGIDYSNLSAVKVGIENGERGEVQELPWGVWKQFPYVIEHKDEEYIRLYPSIGNKSQTIYFANGDEVTKEEFSKYLTPSESKKLMNPSPEDTPLSFTIKRSNILGTDLIEE